MNSRFPSLLHQKDKNTFDNQALDCLQKIDLLAAARCNMFSHALVLYQSTLLNFTMKSAQAYATIANSFKGYQQYDFMIVKELAETSSRLAKKISGEDGTGNKDKLFFGAEYYDNVEQAQEASTIDNTSTLHEEVDEKLVNVDSDPGHILSMNISHLNIQSSGNKRIQNTPAADGDLKDVFHEMPLGEDERSNGMQLHHLELEKSLAELDLAMDSFTGSGTVFDFNKAISLVPESTQEHNQQSLQLLTSENVALLEDILNSRPNVNTEWDSISSDTFLPPGILKQSLGDAIISERTIIHGIVKKKEHAGKANENSWLDLFVELDPLANNSIESLTKSGDSNAPA